MLKMEWNKPQVRELDVLMTEYHSGNGNGHIFHGNGHGYGHLSHGNGNGYGHVCANS